MTKRVKLVVEYDGTDFRGWAAQSGLRTVQSTLKEAVHRVSGEENEIIGASRTDSGAHALGQVCHFDSDVDILPHKWVRALNHVLPKDMGIKSATFMGSDFNSRFCAIDRWYRYRIRQGPRQPVIGRFAHSETRPVNVEAMGSAARHLVGEHDFRAFTADLDPTIENTVRKLTKVEVTQVKKEIRIDIVGTAFLRGMMRRMSGALLEIGLGKRKEEEIGLLLKGKDLHGPVVLPAGGLTLMKVRYGRHPKDHRENSFEED